ncbi:MAG TPA: hypothetical protein VFY27_01460 [Woeseiaceae bacterium]|nr:hypothetical protein [Woeseiaceae bacterium]
MKRTVALFFVLSLPGACGKELPQPTVAEFMEDPILLEATIVRCGEDRSATRYDAACVSARDAVDRIAAAREQERRMELEAESERKRQALRRTQEAAAESRRLAEEAEKRREEAAYYGEFEPLPAEVETSEERPAAGEDETSNAAGTGILKDTPLPGNSRPALPDDGVVRMPVVTESEPGVSTGIETEAPAAAEPDAVPEELKRRQDEGQE